MSKPTRLQQITPEKAREYADACADVLCWFHGFRAGNDEATMPPAWLLLREISIDMKDHASAGEEC
jgi:hypothetical protein